MRAWHVVVVAVAITGLGCGRLNFDELPDAVSDATIFHLQTIEPPYVRAPANTTSLTVGAGNTLIVASYWEIGPNTITVTDSLGLTWQALAARDNLSCAPKSSGAQLWFATAPSTATFDITITQTTTAPLGLRVLEYSGIAGLEASADNIAAAASNDMTAGVLPHAQPALTVALFIDTQGAGTMRPGAGWTQRSIETAFYILIEDNAPGAPPGETEPTAMLPTGTSDTCWTAVAGTFR